MRPNCSRVNVNVASWVCWCTIFKLPLSPHFQLVTALWFLATFGFLLFGSILFRPTIPNKHNKQCSTWWNPCSSVVSYCFPVSQHFSFCACPFMIDFAKILIIHDPAVGPCRSTSSAFKCTIESVFECPSLHFYSLTSSLALLTLLTHSRHSHIHTIASSYVFLQHRWFLLSCTREPYQGQQGCSEWWSTFDISRECWYMVHPLWHNHVMS